MDLEKPVTTWDVLLALGFEPDDGVWSDISPGLSYDFGDFTLSAGAVTNLRFHKVILFSAAYRGNMIQFEMPREVNSREQCIAWIVAHLDKRNKPFLPARHTEWLAEGRQCFHLLPFPVKAATN